MTYAKATVVPVDRTRGEIERMLRGVGANAIGSMSDQNGAIVIFQLNTRAYRMTVPIPPLDEFAHGPGRKARSANAMRDMRAQVERSRWRALRLVLKAKLEAIEAGISTLEQELAMHTIMPDGKTVSERVLPWIKEAYASGDVPALLEYRQ